MASAMRAQRPTDGLWVLGVSSPDDPDIAEWLARPDASWKDLNVGMTLLAYRHELTVEQQRSCLLVGVYATATSEPALRYEVYMPSDPLVRATVFDLLISYRGEPELGGDDAYQALAVRYAASRAAQGLPPTPGMLRVTGRTSIGRIITRLPISNSSDRRVQQSDGSWIEAIEGEPDDAAAEWIRASSPSDFWPIYRTLVRESAKIDALVHPTLLLAIYPSRTAERASSYEWFVWATLERGMISSSLAQIASADGMAASDAIVAYEVRIRARNQGFDIGPYTGPIRHQPPRSKVEAVRLRQFEMQDRRLAMEAIGRGGGGRATIEPVTYERPAAVAVESEKRKKKKKKKRPEDRVPLPTDASAIAAGLDPADDDDQSEPEEEEGGGPEPDVTPSLPTEPDATPSPIPTNKADAFKYELARLRELHPTMSRSELREAAHHTPLMQSFAIAEERDRQADIRACRLRDDRLPRAASAAIAPVRVPSPPRHHHHQQQQPRGRTRQHLDQFNAGVTGTTTLRHGLLDDTEDPNAEYEASVRALAATRL